MKRSSPRRFALAAFVAAVLAAGAAAFVHAQIPRTFRNLQVLPKDIQRPALILQMREMAGALGVRCNHCHTGGNPETLEGMDFASDSLETKRVARLMMRMTREINRTFLPQTGRDSTRRAEVKCVTCHHGARRPETLADTLLRALDRGGAPATIAAYRALRETFHGRSVYDFGEPTLWWVADQASRRSGRVDAAITILELNLEFFPRSVNTRTALGDMLLAMGDTVQAIQRLEEAVRLAPGDAFVKGKLEAARGAKR